MIDAKDMFRTYVNVVSLIAAAVCVVVWLVIAVSTCHGSARSGDCRPDDAYILVPDDRSIPLWDYQQLPMKDCAWCHRTVNLNRHHVIPQAANPALRDVRENLVVLCRDCHFVLGHRCDWKQYNPDVLYICTHFTNCVRSADTRRILTTAPSVPDCANWGHVPPSRPAQDTEHILHVTNDVPDRQKSALERILKWNQEEQTQLLR